jgi:hypothetical protein
MPAGVAEAGRRRQDVDEVRRRPLPRDDELDDVVEQAGDASDQHQPPGAALEDEESNHRNDAEHDLPDASTSVDQIHHMDQGTPIDLLDEPGDRDVERKHIVRHDQVGVDREQDENDQGGGAEPPPGCGARSPGDHLRSSLLGFGERRRRVLGLRAHRLRIICTAGACPRRGSGTG